MSVDDDPSGKVIDDSETSQVSGLISRLLRWGVRVSFALIVAGIVVAFATGTLSRGSVTELTGESAAFQPSFHWLLHGLASGQATALIVLGLLLLIATPVLRVLLSLAFVAKQRDRAYTLITAAVLALLTLSFILGKAAP